MTEEYESYFERVDSLISLKNAIGKEAEKLGFEIRLLGGLLKFTPTGLYSKVYLELEQSGFTEKISIYKHRNHELTKAHKGKKITKKWVISFLQHNSSEAKRQILEKEANEKDFEKEDDNKIRRAKPLLVSQKETEKNAEFGYSSGKSLCPVCHGDGGARGECYKCSGSGWA